MIAFKFYAIMSYLSVVIFEIRHIKTIIALPIIEFIKRTTRYFVRFGQIPPDGMLILFPPRRQRSAADSQQKEPESINLITTPFTYSKLCASAQEYDHNVYDTEQCVRLCPKLDELSFCEPSIVLPITFFYYYYLFVIILYFLLLLLYFNKHILALFRAIHRS